MDHRLREAPEVLDAVIDILETLADSIQDGEYTTVPIHEFKTCHKMKYPHCK